MDNFSRYISSRLKKAHECRDSDKFEASLLYCRHANECMIKYQYDRMFDQLPEASQDQEFIPITRFLKLIKPDTPDLVWQCFVSINNLTRKSMHYNESEDIVELDSSFINSVVGLIETAYNNLKTEYPINLEIEINEHEINRDALAKDASEIRQISLADYVSDDVLVVLKGFADVGITALQNDELFSLDDQVVVALALIHLGDLDKAESLL